jgi:prolyl-tRNA synthetase
VDESMVKKNEMGITVSKSEDIAEWYSQVVLKSELADYSAVKGCAVIRPLGYGVWQLIMDYFNARLKTIGVKNAYFPLFIPESFFQKEADHVDGFAPELAWIEQKSDSKERLAVRPTSETIMYDSYAKWIRSYRDLPLRINQWANVVRWEVSDVKLFLRSREFLWQEGHCVYATDDEAEAEAKLMIEEYKKLSEELLAVPAVIGKKSEKEKFPGAKHTYTIESFMPDGKALQAGTSHHLGQGFAKGFAITYRGKDEEDHYPFQTSWGFSTRIMGSMIMMHSDDKGLILPPRAAPTQAVIIPITNKKFPEQKEAVLDAAFTLKKELEAVGLRIDIDDREEYSPGFKYGDAELKGTPYRIELGNRDLEQGVATLASRLGGEKIQVSLTELQTTLPDLLDTFHAELFARAKKAVASRKAEVQDYDAFKKATMEESKYVLVAHCAKEACEEAIKTETNGVTTRCRPDGEDTVSDEVCIRCQEKAAYKIIFSRNY